ncbi:MAG: hypothetical protein E6J26_10815 [Chloroflexi bacterium]|nr:MAG: hypothetical protein E6J26_10815 [Chloroflexota bacterium]
MTLVIASFSVVGGQALEKQPGAGTGVGCSLTIRASGVLVAEGASVGAAVGDRSGVADGEGALPVGVNGAGLGGTLAAQALRHRQKAQRRRSINPAVAWPMLVGR